MMSELEGYKLDQWKLLQGQFLDRKQYDHMGSDWKAARDHEEKMTIRLGGLEGLIVARMQSHTLPPRDAEKFVGQLVREHNALAGRDPAKLEGLVEAVKYLLIANGCSCDNDGYVDPGFGLSGDRRCAEHRLQDALAAFEANTQPEVSE